MTEVVTKYKKGKQKNIKQKNGAQKELGLRDTESAGFYQYLYTMRRGRQEGRKSDKRPLS